MRDYLRAHPEVARQYGELKKRLAAQYPEDADKYSEGKTEAILRILEAAGFRADELEMIARVNGRAV